MSTRTTRSTASGGARIATPSHGERPAADAVEAGRAYGIDVARIVAAIDERLATTDGDPGPAAPPIPIARS